MRPPSEPEINRDNPNKYFIYWNHDVPMLLWDYYPRKRVRIKKYDDINRYSGQEREDYAEERRAVWAFALSKLNYNPFEELLASLDEATERKQVSVAKIEAKAEKAKATKSLSPEERRKLMPIKDALENFIKSRHARKLAKASLDAYQGLVDWFYEGLQANDYADIKVGELKHIHVTSAMDYIAEEREWSATTINKGYDFLTSLFNWLESEEYIVKNPSKGKFIKLPTHKTKHTWYDRDIKEKVKQAVLAAGDDKVYRAMQFTYWLMIRSKKELRMLKVGDIDQRLKRVRFTAELAKNNNEEYRDYVAEFQQVVDEMKLSEYPAHYFVFGSKDGTPGDKMCSHNFFSKRFKVIKDRIELSMDYTIYGFKHTRIVHEMMKGTDGYLISHMARHIDRKSTEDYKRDYDITLVNVYAPEDLTF